MKQYRITQADFVLPGESGDADAVMDTNDLAEIKKLAGITGLLEAGAGMYTGHNTVPQAAEVGQKISTLPAIPFNQAICSSPFFNKF